MSVKVTVVQMTNRAGAQDLPGLAENIQWAMDRLPDRSGERWTYVALAQACAERGTEISPAALRHYASGRRKAPPARLLFALSDVFGLDPRFFWHDTDRIKGEIGKLVTRRGSDAMPGHAAEDA